jgi:hypothetical protein
LFQLWVGITLQRLGTVPKLTELAQLPSLISLEAIEQLMKGPGSMPGAWHTGPSMGQAAIDGLPGLWGSKRKQEVVSAVYLAEL